MECVAKDGRVCYVPLCYLNELKLQQSQSHHYQLLQHESCIVPVHGQIEVEVGGETWTIGSREDLWKGVPNGVYVPVDTPAQIS